MSYIGTVENGVVVLPEAAYLIEGTRVRVEPLKRGINRKPAAKGRAKPVRRPTLAESLKKFIGIIKGPPDWAANHDHSIHGKPKR